MIEENTKENGLTSPEDKAFSENGSAESISAENISAENGSASVKKPTTESVSADEIASGIRYSADVMLGCVLDIAEELIECGAEIQRVEDTVERICTAYGACKTEVFVTTSLIVATIGMPDGYHKTQTRRIYSTQTNFSRIEELNALSRRICATIPTPEEFKRLYRESKKRIKNKYAERYVGAFLLVSAFTLFFGGGFRDALSAGIIALAVTTLIFFGPKWTNALAHTVVCSLAGGFLSLLAVFIGLGVNADKIMIGTIMLLIPGIDIGNSLRDLLCGDIVSGSIRLIKALLTASAIAVGYSIAVMAGGALNVL